MRLRPARARLALLPAVALLPALALSALAGPCAIDIAAVEARIAALEPRYGAVLSDIGCDINDIPSRQMMCDAADAPGGGDLWRMGRLDDLAWVHAVENATGQEVDLAAPPPDDAFIAARDACSDAACLCSVLIRHTNASLGGTSPYPQ